MNGMRALPRLKSLVLFGCFLVFLHGCGGGGGGGGGSGGGSSNPPPAVAALTIASQPVNATVEFGGSVQFASTPSRPAAAQWYRDDVAIPDAQGTEYWLAEASMADNGARFYVVFSDQGQSITSQEVVLTVTPPPLGIAMQPVSAHVEQDSQAVFDVAVNAGLAPAYQWQRSTDAGASWTDIPAATQATYTTPAVGLADHGTKFRVSLREGESELLSAEVFLQVKPRFALAAGKPGGCGYFDSSDDTARLCGPTGVAVGTGGNLFVFEMENRIRQVAPGGALSTFRTFDFDTITEQGRMVSDAAGTLYVALPTASIIRKVFHGSYSDFAGSGVQGWADGSAATAKFFWPMGLSFDGSGNLYVADAGNHMIRKITPAGVVTTVVGAPGSPTAGLLDDPRGVAIAANGDMIVADSGNDVVRRITPAGVATIVAGVAGLHGFANGTGSAARFRYPSDVVIDAAGVIYVTDTWNHSIRRIATNGAVTTLAGSGQFGSADGAGSAGLLSIPTSLAFEAGGNLLIADTGNHAIRRLAPGGQLTTMAGMRPTRDAVDGAGTSARFDEIGSITIGPDGTTYVIDGAAIRTLDPQGVVSTFAGQVDLGGNANGSASSALLDQPKGIAVAPNGDVFIAEAGGCQIRLVSGGIVSTFAGAYGACSFADGQGGAARFAQPRALTWAPNGDLLVADDSAVRRVTPTGIVTTVAGINDNYKAMVDGPIANARFYDVTAIAVDGETIYVVDYKNVVRRISGGQVTTLYNQDMFTEIYINALVVNSGKIYMANDAATVGVLLPATQPEDSVFLPMLTGAGGRTVRVGPDSLINGMSGLAITSDGRLMIATEGVLLISE